MCHWSAVFSRSILTLFAGPACWWRWPASLRDREPQALAEARARLGDALEYLTFEQFLFFGQWMALKAYANERDIKLFGDMPIFVAHDSAEVWAHPELFDLDAEGMPRKVAGVPPDYFSETGQRWGNPLYDWDRMGVDGYAFWINRMHVQLELFDIVRIDHFRGFEAFWEIPAEDENAINGRWVAAPGDELFDRLHDEFDPLPLVAEDLGIITPEVDALRRRYGLPGMRILQFAFGDGPDNPYLPFHHPRNTVVYTGTHDNDTCVGWFNGLQPHEKEFVFQILETKPRDDIAWLMIETAMQTEANMAIAPLQDFLGLDTSARMNTPGVAEGNWRWRFTWDMLPDDLPQRIHSNIQASGRLYAR